MLVGAKGNCRTGKLGRFAMAATIGKFEYRIIAPRKGDPPFSPFIHIGLENWSTAADGWPRLTPQLMTDGEIDYYVSKFKADLDKVGRLAKRALQRANEKLHS